MKTLKLKLASTLLAVLVVFTACSDDDGSQNPSSPELPPEASMSANLGNFPSNGESSGNGSAANLEQNDHSNFAFAATNVVFWQTILNVQLAIPVAAFHEAFNHSFEYLPEQAKWRSEYTVQVNNQSITATLYAEYNNADQIEWEMYLTAPGQFEDYLWFRGESQTDGSGGTWYLSKGPAQSGEVLSITWDRQGENVVNAIYTLVDEQSERNGSYIEYGVTTESGYTHFYDISIVSETEADYDVLIYYNEDTQEGTVRSEAHFETSTFMCWDSDFQNTACEQ
ncbi:hypothetical protein [Roseivirga pacifica]